MLNIKTDSRKVVLGDTFVALRGYTVDGHNYIEEAIKNGATKIVCEYGKYDVDTLSVPDTYCYLKDYLVNNYATNFKNLRIIGVTGTSGKTTTCFLTYQLLKKLGIKCCYIGTLGFYIDDKIKDLSNTTPDILELYNLLFTALDNNIDVVVMEVSSHAIDLERIKGLKFSVCAFTNLSRDHLDYHKTMDEYRKCKVKIIDYLKEDGKIIVNTDSEYSKYFMCPKSLSLGINGSDYKIIDYKLNSNYTDITFSCSNTIYDTRINLIGKYNIYNYLTSVGIVNNLGININDIISVSNQVYAPVGRTEIIKVGNSIAVIDYAHKPDAVSKVTNSFRNIVKGRLITIVGCGGNRDKTKRPIMGNIATENSDYVIFTDDNPRYEESQDIINDILKGVKKDNYIVINNRKDAIKYGLELLKNDDILLILGKGHEDYQIIGNKKTHLSDKEEVMKYISEN